MVCVRPLKYALDPTLTSHRFRHFYISPVRLHSAALSLTFLGFFDVSPELEAFFCPGSQEHAHMADIRGGARADVVS